MAPARLERIRNRIAGTSGLLVLLGIVVLFLPRPTGGQRLVGGVAVAVGCGGLLYYVRRLR
jgi:hypothetical protein